MRLTILLSLVIAFAFAWLALALVRDHAARMQDLLSRVIAQHVQNQQMDRLIRQNQQIRRGQQDLRRRVEHGEAPAPEGDPPPELPEWVAARVTVREKRKGWTISINQTFGMKLAHVPAGWFHGAFAIGIVVLCILALVEAHGIPGA